MLKPNERLLNDEPGAAGGGAAPAAPAAAPAAEPAPPADGAAAAPAGAPAEPAEPFAGLSAALDAVGADPAATPAAPAQPRVAGKFAAASQRAAGVAAPAATPAPAAAGPVPPAPKPGEVDLTPPEGMNERSQQRWASLTDRVKGIPDLERRATESEAALNSVRNLVAGSGLAPAEFSEMLEMSRLSRSQNPQDAQRALQMLDAQRAQLATRLGIDAPGVDVLAVHPDLKQKVDGMLITREDALEIVRLRNAEQTNQRTAQAQRASAQEHAQHVQAVNTAAANMERTLAAMAGTPGHEAKVKYITEHLANPQNLQAFVSTYQPQQWDSVLLAMYRAYTPPPAPPAPPQPLRPGNVGAGAQVRSGPVTAESAVDGAFARLGF